ALDADRCRLAELDFEAEVARQRRLDDFFLHLAIQRDEQLLTNVVLPHVDQRVLLGQLGEGNAERPSVGRTPRHDHRLERRRREVVFASRRAPLADRVADLNIGQAVELRDLPGRYTGTLNRGALVEDADRRDLGFVLAAELDAVPYSKNAREHAHIGDLLAGGTAFHFEHSAR